MHGGGSELSRVPVGLSCHPLRLEEPEEGSATAPFTHTRHQMEKQSVPTARPIISACTSQ